MSTYLRLAENDRAMRRSVADALAVLRTIPAFTDSAQAHISVGPLRLPSGKIVGLVDLEFRSSEVDDAIFVVSLPTSATFRAIHPAASRQDHIEIWALDGAIADTRANVRLSNGAVLRAVEMIPAHLSYDPSPLDWHIIYNLILMLGAQDRCFPYWRDKVSPDIQKMVPDHLRFIDCNAVSQLTAPPLKVVAAFIADHNETAKTPSLQKIADALGTFGVRVAAPRPRKRSSRGSATI